MVGKKWLWLGILALCLLWPISAAWADGPQITLDEGRIFVNEDVILEPGEVFDGDLGVFDGDLIVPADSVVQGDVFVTNGDVFLAGRVDGDLAVIGGNLEQAETGRIRGDVFVSSGNGGIAGRVDGDVMALFGNLQVRDSAIVDGDLMVMSGKLDRAVGAQVRGEQLPGAPLPGTPSVPRAEPVPTPAYPQRETLGQKIGRLLGRVLAAAFLSLLVIAAGLLIVFIWPRHTHKVAECIRLMPLQSFGLGLLTFLIAALLESLAMVLMIIIILIAAALISTLILIPVGVLVAILSVLVLLPVPLVTLGAMMLGWVSLAQAVGQKAVQVLEAGYVRPLGATLVGLLITVPLAALLWVLKPLCCAWPFVILLTSVGLGAAILTRFGTQNCQAVRTPPPADVLPAEAMEEEVGEPDVPLP